jgi:hypothetical protein
MRPMVVAGAALLALGLGGLLPVQAQEITYSISPGAIVTFGDAPYGKSARTPNEIYSPNPLNAYKTPEDAYYSYPTFDIHDVEGRRLPKRRLRQEDWLR